MDEGFSVMDWGAARRRARRFSGGPSQPGPYPAVLRAQPTPPPDSARPAPRRSAWSAQAPAAGAPIKPQPPPSGARAPAPAPDWANPFSLDLPSELLVMRAVSVAARRRRRSVAAPSSASRQLWDRSFAPPQVQGVCLEEEASEEGPPGGGSGSDGPRSGAHSSRGSEAGEAAAEPPASPTTEPAVPMRHSARLPADVMVAVCTWLSRVDVALGVSRVSRQWAAAASNPVLSEALSWRREAPALEALCGAGARRQRLWQRLVAELSGRLTDLDFSCSNAEAPSVLAALRRAPRLWRLDLSSLPAVDDTLLASVAVCPCCASRPRSPPAAPPAGRCARPQRLRPQRAARPVPTLRELLLSWNAGLSQGGLLTLASGNSLLTKLDISGCTGVSPQGLAAVAAALPRLDTLLARSTRADARLLVSAPLSLRVADLSSCCGVGDAGLRVLSESRVCLEELFLAGCPVSDAGLAALAAQCPQRLAVLSVAACRMVTDRGLGELAAVGTLQRLFADRTKAGASGVARVLSGCCRLSSLSAVGCLLLQRDAQVGGRLAELRPNWTRLTPQTRAYLQERRRSS